MRPLEQSLGLTDRVYQALVDEMSEGRLAPGQHLVQEQLAAELGVSRQPVQQALALLKSEGLVVERGKRGLFVAPLDSATMRHRYEIRSALDGLAARRAAERCHADPSIADETARDGKRLIAAGHVAVADGSIAAMVRCDVAFHDFISAASGNPLIAQTAALHWRQLKRIMGEVLRLAGPPATIWRQHETILAAIVAGDASRAEAEAIAHAWTAADRLDRVIAAITGANEQHTPGRAFAHKARRLASTKEQ